MTGSWRSGRVAAAAGVNLETLRYYERRGLLEQPHRTLGGHRLYPPETVSVLRLIKTAQRLGFTLDEVAELLSVGSNHPSRRADAGLQARARIKLVEVEEKIAGLMEIRDTLRRAIAAGCDDLSACADSPCCPLPFTGPVPDGRSEPPADSRSGALSDDRSAAPADGSPVQPCRQSRIEP